MSATGDSRAAHGSDAPPVVVCARAVPESGMESVVHRVMLLLNEQQRVEAVVATGRPWDDVPMVSLGGRVAGPLRLAVIWLRLWRARRRFEDRVVVLSGVWVALAFLAVPFVRARSVIVWEHSLIPDKIRTSRKLRVLAAVAAVLYRRADRIVCVSEPLAAAVSARTRHSAVQVVHNPLPPEHLDEAGLAARGSTPDAARLTTIGALTGTKNQAEVIRALAELPSARLRVLGDGPLRGELIRLCDELGVADRVEFLGHVSRSDVEKVLDETGILVHPSRGETFGMVYFEAAQAGIPVVAASNALSEWCVPTYVPGLTYRDGVPGVIDAVHRVGDATSADALVAAYRRRVAEFDAARVVTAWREIVADARGGGLR